MSNDFELRLAGNLRALGDAGLRPIDPVATAATVISTGKRRWIGSSPLKIAGLRPVWIAAILLVLLLALLAALAGARLLMTKPAPLQPLTVISVGALYSGSTDGDSLTSLGSGRDLPDVMYPTSDYKAVRWSPARNLLAVAIGQEPGDTFWHGVAVYDAVGSLLGYMSDAEDFAWAPDSHHLLLAPLAPSKDEQLL